MGGRGSSGAMGGGFDDGPKGSKKTEGKAMFPAYFNKQGRFASVEGAEKIFSDKYKNADKEYGISVDKEGFVHKASSGGSGSVKIYTTGKEQTIIHNHPSGGNFSLPDLKNFSRDTHCKAAKAVGPKITYSISKTNKFDHKRFKAACEKAKWPKRLSYDKGAEWWLKRNQKAFGYKYESYKTR